MNYRLLQKVQGLARDFASPYNYETGSPYLSRPELHDIAHDVLAEVDTLGNPEVVNRACEALLIHDYQTVAAILKEVP